MKKVITIILRYIMLFCVVFSSLQSPLMVFADAIDDSLLVPKKGDMKLGEDGEIISGDSISVTATNGKIGEGKVSVEKTVSKSSSNGKFNVSFDIIGEDYLTSTSTTLPSYTVFVLDASGSMRGTRWTNAKNAAINFSEKLIEAGRYTEDGVVKNTNNIALVTFDGSVVEKSDGFSQNAFVNDDLGSTGSGTNYQSGFDVAYSYLNSLSADVKNNSSLNVIFISDGQPNRGNCVSISSCNSSLATLKSLGNGVNIYTFAYELYDASSINLLKSISTNDKVENVNVDNINSILESFVETVSGSTPAGTTSSFVDNLGDKFKIVSINDTYNYGESYTSDAITTITNEGINISFDIQIDINADTGWYNTNAGFELIYVDSKTGETETISCDENPYVYWENYKYTVKYFKDSLEGELLGTYTYTTDKDSVIDINDIEINKHLSDAGNGYEFNLVSPESIIANDNMNPVIINVIYTLKEYNYDVEYYYDNVLDSSKSDIGPVTHGEKVDPKGYYLESIRDGYKLDTDKSDSELVVIDSNDEVIRIYYIKDNFDYTVNYHFGKEETIDNDLTLRDSALFGSTINPSDKYLSNDKLISERYDDYFLNPNKPHLPSEGLIIGSDSSKNNIDIYYINTEIVGEDITKKANKTIISSSSDLIQYTVNYKSSIENVKENSEVVITIIDTLPKKIDLNKSNLNGGEYDEVSDTITWTITKTVDEFTSLYEIDETIIYTVNYKDFANISSSLNNMLLNTVKGMTTINTDTSDGTEDNEEVEVAIDGTLIIKHVDEEGNELLDTVTITKKVGTSYSESKKDITGYSIKVEPANKEGKYIEGTIILEFIYEKNEYKYTVNYHFNNVLNNSLTVSGNALYESVIKAEDNYLSNDKLISEGYGDFFLNPVKPQDKDEIIIDVEEDNNIINIYYVNNETENEEIEKSTSTDKVDSKSDKVSYSVNYKAEITNVEADSEVVITIVDTLPYEIDEENSNIGTGVYDKNSKTITWTIIKAVDEFTELYKIDETVEYEVLYLNFADISSSEDNVLVNNVNGNTTIGSFETNGHEDEVEVPVEIYGEVVATYRNTEGETLHEDVSSAGLSGSLYETIEKEFYGYTLKSVPSNKNGKYVGEQTIYVDYIYEKNIGTSEEELIKTGDEIVSSIEAPFKYTITYVTEIFDYIGDVEIEIIDIPDVKIDEEKSIISNNCHFENGTIVCNYAKTINSKEDSVLKISEEFTLYYIGINDQKVINRVNSKLVYGEEFKTNDSEFKSIVASGRVISNYVTVDGNVLDEAIIQENLVGSEYVTYEKSFEKYFLKEVVGEENGKFTIEDINVTYVYDLIPMPPQTGYENNFSSIIGLITFILSLFILRKKC